MPRQRPGEAALEATEGVRKITRRHFLEGSGAAIGLAALTALPISFEVPQGSGKADGQKAILIDTTRCRGCNLCVEACKRKNGLPVRDTWPSGLSPDTYTYVRSARDDTYYAKCQCMHCLDPACVSVCPVAALRKSKEGPVYYEASRCFGCRYCEMACPFQVPRYQWDEVWPKVTKCDMCRDRVKDSLPPACVAACQFGTLTFGEREQMLAEAHRRIADKPQTYVNHVYGEHELGGTCVLYLSSIPFEELGLEEMPEEAPPEHTWEDTVKLPWVMGLGVALLIGTWLATNNRGHEKTEDKPQDEGGDS